MQFVKFAVVGAIGVGINEAVLIGMTEQLHLWYGFSNLFAIGVASVWNFIGYRNWAFKQKR